MTDGGVTGKLGLGVLVRLIVRTYRAHAGFLVVAALIVVIPAALLDVLSGHLAEAASDVSDDSDDLMRVVTAAVAGTVLFFGASVGHQLYTGLISSTVAAARAGRSRPTLAQVVPGLPILALVGAEIIYSLGVGLGFLLLVLPGVLFATWYALVAPVLEIERLPLRAAFARSRELVRGHFWVVLTVVALFSVAGQALAAGLEELVAGDSLLGEWLAAILGDVVAIPLLGVAIATLALELSALKGPASRPD
ncbi:MAG: hypothetical protein WD649_04640 [Thermoleophilaceae bacterium]